MNDIVLHKKESIEWCIAQIRSYYAQSGELPFADDFMRQDAIAINLQRACEQAIDLANHTIKTRKLGLPSASRESFRLLSGAGIIPAELAGELEKMVAFRNLLVHDYQRLDVAAMIIIIESHLDDLLKYTNLIVLEFQR